MRIPAVASEWKFGYYCLPCALTSNILTFTLTSDKGIPPHTISQDSSYDIQNSLQWQNTALTLAEKGLCQEFLPCNNLSE